MLPAPFHQRSSRLSTALFVIAGYLAGSMPFGYWLVRVFKGVDIRKVGSGNIGASNVWRTYGRRLGLIVMALDVLKGFVPAFLATIYLGDLAGVLAGVAAMLGHWRPLFLGFQKGGKTVATYGGALLGVAPVVGAIGAGVWIILFLAFRYASVASILGALSLPVVAAALDEPWPVIAYTSVGAAGIVFLHRANIARLRAGTESRFTLRRRKDAAASA
jgi:acyl phosphate:glycerol-3-phosphate acyltransferase